MKKHAARFGIAFVLAMSFSFIPNLKPNDDFLSTIYNVSGIIFAVGIGLVISIDLSKVENEGYLKGFRTDFKRVRDTFIIYFSVSTLCFLSLSYVPKNIRLYKINISFPIFTSVVIIFCIIYFVANFIAVQKLKDDISDRVREERRRRIG